MKISLRVVVLAFTLALISSFSCEHCFAGGSVRGGAGATCADPGVHKAPALWRWMLVAETGRADVIGIGDSNQLYGGYGWDEYFAKALVSRFGMYATGIMSAGENAGWGSGAGFGYQGFSTASGGNFSYAGAPPALDSFLNGGTLHPLYYLFLSSGQAGGFENLGIFLNSNCAINVNGPLRFHVTFGCFEGAGNGFFQPSVRAEQPPYQLFANASVVSTMAESYGESQTTLDLPAATRNCALGFRFCPRGTDMQGPVAILYSSVENTSRDQGVAFSTLYGNGGQSARDMAQSLIDASDTQLTLYFSSIRARQAGQAQEAVLIRINTGLNDRNETEPSVGSLAVLDGDSQEAFGDNITAIINRIRGVWVLNGWDMEELFFLISVSHPVSTPDDSELILYREEAMNVADTDPFGATAVTIFTNMISAEGPGGMLPQGCYQAGGADRNHLTPFGFQLLSDMEVRAMLPHCLGDADANDSVDFADITAVLANFAGCSAFSDLGVGDADADGVVNFSDITTVLSNFDRTCP